MAEVLYEYRTEQFLEPPSADDLKRLSGDGWRLVSVTVDVSLRESAEPLYVAYLERPAAVTAAVTASLPDVLAKADAARKKPTAAI